MSLICVKSPYFYERFLIYAKPEHSIHKKKDIHADDLKEPGLWLLDQGHCFRNQVINLCNHKVNLNAAEQIKFNSGSIETIKNMVKNHSGYSLIPELAVQLPTDEEYLKKMAEPQPAREISLVVHQNFSKGLVLQKIRQKINVHLPEHFQKNDKYSTIKWR